MAGGLERIISGKQTTGTSSVKNKISLGQHWLKDRLILEAIADSAEIQPHETVLEIGPGLGTLTSVLLNRARDVVAVEYDVSLAGKLPGQFPGKRLRVVQADFLTFDLSTMPKGYKVVANVPYYITQKILEHVLASDNQPKGMVLLVQKEVAEKLAAQPGELSKIAVKLQVLYDVQLGIRVQKEYFTPPPKVDSQVVICTKHHVDKKVDFDTVVFTRVVGAGFSAPRKKLGHSLAGGLAHSRESVETWLRANSINPNLRPADVTVDQWKALARTYDQL